MFEKVVEEIAKDIYIHHFDDDVNYPDVLKAITVGVQKGSEFGYNKAKVEVEDSYRESLCNSELNLASVTEQLEELEKANKWHYVKDGDLPKDDIKLAIIEIDDCGYLLCNYRNGFWYDANSGATCAEWITNNIIAWKEIVFPKEIENA